MKKSIFAVLFFAFASVASVNAQITASEDKIVFNDPDYSAKLAQRYYTDHYLYSYAEHPEEFDCCALKKHDVFVGFTGGFQYFDGHFVPNVGATIGWEGKTLGFDYIGTFAKGDYTDEADRSNSYVEFDSKLALKVKIWDNETHSWQVWGGAYGSYKLNFDYHKNESSTTTITETETEIVKKTDTFFNDYEFKGSTMGAGGLLELILRPYMSKVNYRLRAWAGAQQRYYDDGNSFKFEYGAQLIVTVNFNAQKVWDTVFLKNSGVSKKQVKEYNKARRAAR